MYYVYIDGTYIYTKLLGNRIGDILPEPVVLPIYVPIYTTFGN